MLGDERLQQLQIVATTGEEELLLCDAGEGAVSFTDLAMQVKQSDASTHLVMLRRLTLSVMQVLLGREHKVKHRVCISCVPCCLLRASD